MYILNGGKSYWFIAVTVSARFQDAYAFYLKLDVNLIQKCQKTKQISKTSSIIMYIFMKIL